MTQNNRALIIIDMQNDFLPKGALAVPNSDEIISKINQLIEKFDHILLTQDWHPKDHVSFSASHKDKQPFETITMPYGIQTLWPVHCVQGSYGAQITTALHVDKAELILRKGFCKTIDSYSAFFENDHKTPTGLKDYCLERGLTDLSFCGVATDFCVGYSALDALKCGFKASLYLDACRAIDQNNSLAIMLKRLREAGAELFLGT